MLAAAVYAQAPTADLIVTNAKVWTVDKSQPEVQAVAVLGDRIVAVGSSADVEAWRGPKTKVVDARGRRVVPGFNDSHVHFSAGGQQLDRINLKDATTTEEFVRRIGEDVARTPAGDWVLGGNWDHEMWTPAELPTRHMLDPVSPTTPVFLTRYDGHMAIVNSVALRRAGITARTPDPPGGTIVRDAQGRPTGALKDAAMDLVTKHIPPVTRERRLRGIQRALEHAASLGVTSVQEMGTSFQEPGSESADFVLYAELAERGELTTRIYAAPALTEWESLAKIGIRRAFGSPYLRLGALKAYSDGSLGSTTAYFFEPYDDSSQTKGLLAAGMLPLPRMRGRMMKADEAGLQLCIHAIGDQAISIVLDLFRDVTMANGPRDRRLRIEHSQHIAPKDFERYAAQNVIASMQPYHAIDDGRWAEKRIGPVRLKGTYAFRTLLNHGVRLAFGTDWDVAPLDPMQGLYAAVTRATLDGKNPQGWIPEQKISLAEAVEAYTMGSAYAEFQENEKGSITVGKLADLVILGDDIFSIAPEAIRNVR
ncbi:MAG: amidohydrolase [Terriglobales bacterium]